MIKSMYKATIVVCVISIVCVSFSTGAFAQATAIKIGFVDLQRIIDASEEGQQVRADIQKEADKLSQQAEQMQEKIDTLRNEYQEQTEFLTADAKQEKRDEIGKLELDYSRFVKDSRTELQKAEQRALQQLLIEIGKIIVEYGQENEYTVILEAGNILYGADSINLTDDIVNYYNLKKIQ